MNNILENVSFMHWYFSSNFIGGTGRDSCSYDWSTDLCRHSMFFNCFQEIFNSMNSSDGFNSGLYASISFR